MLKSTLIMSYSIIIYKNLFPCMENTNNKIDTKKGNQLSYS